MPYIDKYQRDFYIEFLREIRSYPAWRSPEDLEKHDVLLGMLFEWLKVKHKDNPLKIDGDVNFMCTWILKHTQRTYHTPDFHKTKIYNPLNKDAAEFVRDLLTAMFEHQQGYANYERLYGLVSLMEAEFERRGWSLGRPDLKNFFKAEKKYWLKRIAEYEDKKIEANGDVE
jgi:hypothetical protein